MQGISKILYTSSVFANHYDQTLTPFPLHFPIPRLYQCKASVRQDFQLTSCSRNHLQFIFFTWALLPVPLFTHFHLKIQIQGSELTRVTKYVGEVAADRTQPWEHRVPSPLHAAGEQPGAKPLPTFQAAASQIWHNHFTVRKYHTSCCPNHCIYVSDGQWVGDEQLMLSWKAAIPQRALDWPSSPYQMISVKKSYHFLLNRSAVSSILHFKWLILISSSILKKPESRNHPSKKMRCMNWTFGVIFARVTAVIH